MEKCQTCRFYACVIVGNDNDLGECHRHAPLPMTGDFSYLGWPSVRQDDWCGEYQPLPLDQVKG